jgi:hypothetical protein
MTMNTVTTLTTLTTRPWPGLTVTTLALRTPADEQDRMGQTGSPRDHQHGQRLRSHAAYSLDANRVFLAARACLRA